jgi:hypothetical protein
VAVGMQAAPSTRTQSKTASRPPQHLVKGVSVARHPTVPVQTAERMIQMVVSAIRDPKVLEVAKAQVKHVVTENTDPTLSAFSEIAAIHGFATRHLRYTRDPRYVELVFDAPATLSLIQKHGKWSEDCDSYAVLVATLLASIGHRVRITLAGFTATPDAYSHVFCEAHIPRKGWVIVDPSMGPRVGKMAKSIKTLRHFEIPAPAQRPTRFQQAARR